MEDIRQVDLTQTPLETFSKHLGDVVILTADNRLLFHHRPWSDTITLFGGHVESGEQPIEAAAREINEETGGVLSPADLVHVGTVTESWTNHTEAVHVYFWHDKKNSITGCYEGGEALAFNTTKEAQEHPKIMAYAKWAVNECLNQKLLPDLTHHRNHHPSAGCRGMP